jgi:hypothetical protein
MTSAALHIRALGPDEIGLAIEWAAAEGWNPGLHDAACFHAADPGGFLVGSLGEEPVATISVVKYGATFGFLGLYIVKKAFRGKGYGMQVWKAGLARLQHDHSLIGDVAQQDNYRTSGFRLVSQHPVSGDGYRRRPSMQGSFRCRRYRGENDRLRSRFFPTTARTFCAAGSPSPKYRARHSCAGARWRATVSSAALAKVTRVVHLRR